MEPIQISMLHDITSNCNLRCPFCTNNWEHIHGNINMTEETFERIINIIPLAGKESFFFSCAFEPTLNKNFIKLLKLIPYNLKDKVFFTTNLTNKLSLDTIIQLSKINIHHINISIESFNPVLYESFRKGSDNEIFMKNLGIINNIFKVTQRTENSPKIKFITMAFKQNYDELDELITICRDLYGAYIHEIRTPFAFSYGLMDKGFINRSKLSIDQLNILKEKYKDNKDIILMFDEDNINNNSTCSKNLNIRIESNGDITFSNNDKYNINDIEDPYNFVKEKLLWLRDNWLNVK